MEEVTEATSSPLKRFGDELARLRTLRGWSQVRLGKLMGFSHGWISLIERGKRVPTPQFALRADEIFGVAGVFTELRRQITNAALIEGVQEFAVEEARCRELREYQTTIIPGLFQTPEYAEALTMADVVRGTLPLKQAEEQLAFLAGRQRRVFERSNPPLIHSVMDEACLTRMVGGPKVMGQQLDHLMAMASRPNITVQVAPPSLGHLIPFTFPIVLLRMPNRSVIGYAESYARGFVERTATVCAAWERGYDQLQTEAPNTMASVATIGKIRKGFE